MNEETKANYCKEYEKETGKKATWFHWNGSTSHEIYNNGFVDWLETRLEAAEAELSSTGEYVPIEKLKETEAQNKKLVAFFKEYSIKTEQIESLKEQNKKLVAKFEQVRELLEECQKWILKESSLWKSNEKGNFKRWASLLKKLDELLKEGE